MKTVIPFSVECPHCKKDFVSELEVDPNTVDMSPNIACPGLKPIGNICVYRISSDIIAKYLLDKTRKMVPNAKLEVVPRYIEKKRRRAHEPRRSYAALLIGMSDDVVEDAGDNSWVASIGRDTTNVRIIKEMFNAIVGRFRFDPKKVASWMKDYEVKEHLEEQFGITDDYIGELKKYSVPQRFTGGDKKGWIMFAAAPEKIIQDMLTDPDTGRVPGKLSIVDTIPVSSGVVEYVVYLNPKDLDLSEKDNVRKIMEGELKGKK